MPIRFRTAVFLALIGAAIGLAVFGIYSYRHRFVRSNPDLLGLLPESGMTTFFADCRTLRNSGILDMFAGSKRTVDTDYEQFVQQTEFNYRTDIDAIAAVMDKTQLFAVVAGRFHWSRLRQYASTHDGSCADRTCSLPIRNRTKWMSFLSVQPDVMALALSADKSAVEVLFPLKRHTAGGQFSPRPVWVHVSKSVLTNPSALPASFRIFAIALQSADSVVFSLAQAPENESAPFNLQLDAVCPSAATAETVRTQLDIQTKMLKLELARERAKPNPADLTGLLTAGAFQVVNKKVIGNWPIRQELLKALE